jgi:hypothetical protein
MLLHFHLNLTLFFDFDKIFVFNVPVYTGTGSAWIRIHFQSWIRIRIPLKKLDPYPDPQKVNADPKHWFADNKQCL